MLRDLRHAVRVLLRAKGWTAIVLVSLALGIGANAALFSAVNGVLLRSIPVTDPDGIVRLGWFGDNDMARSRSEYGFGGELPNGQRRHTTFSYPAFEQLREANHALAGMFACAPNGDVNVIVDGQAEIASSFVASGDYFDVIGMHAAAGRTITSEDDVPGAAAVAMISHGYWNRRFGLSPAAIGQVVTINDLRVTIVGVTAPDYRGVQGSGRSVHEIHLPLSLDAELGGGDRLREPTYWWLQIMGRRKAGVTAAQVQGNLDGVFQATSRQGLDSYLDNLSSESRALSGNQDLTAVPRLWVDSGRRGVYEANPDTRRDARLLGGVVILVLLIVCANVANLLLSRATSRRQEISVRLSLGATRGRLVRQLLTESLLLSAAGGGLGLLVAHGARQLLPFGREAPLDGRVLAFVALLSIATGVVFGLAPAFRATRIDLSASLKENSRSISGSRNLLSKGLLVVQVAVSLVLLMGAGLFLNTLRHLRAVDIGFDASNILLFRVDPTLSGYDQDRIPLLYEQMRESIEAVAGIRSVSLSRSAFLSGSTSSSTVHFDGRDDRESDSVHMMTVSPEFFETMSISLLAGRLFEKRDGMDAPQVAIVNSAAVREFLGNDDALGRRFGFSPEERKEWEIVGVVRDVKYASLREASPPTVFLPHAQRHAGSMVFEVKTETDPRGFVPTVRETVRRIDSKMPLMRVSTQAEQIEERFRQERFFAQSYLLFGGLAMLLAAMGLFGLASYNVAMRTNEIGIRMALGAQRGEVLRMILRESLMLVIVGVGLGMMASFAAGRLVERLVFGVEPTDVPTMLVAAITVVFVSIVASYLPAHRASRVDPMVALQGDRYLFR